MNIFFKFSICFCFIFSFLSCKKGEDILFGHDLNKMDATISGGALTATHVNQLLSGKNLTITGEFPNSKIITIAFPQFDTNLKGTFTINSSSSSQLIAAYNNGIPGTADDLAVSGTVTIDYNSNSTKLVRGTFDLITQKNVHISSGTYQAVNY
jgi:hypothetical protein